MRNVYRYDCYEIGDSILVQCLQMFQSMIVKDLIRCRKHKPENAFVFIRFDQSRGRWDPIKVLGWGLLEFEQDNGIIQIFVDQDHRRKGYGADLFAEMDEFNLIHSKKTSYFKSDNISRKFYNSVHK